MLPQSVWDQWVQSKQTHSGPRPHQKNPTHVHAGNVRLPHAQYMQNTSQGTVFYTRLMCSAALHAIITVKPFMHVSDKMLRIVEEDLYVPS